MAIMTHHIHNVLRAYSKRLSQDRALPEDTGITDQQRPDQITISARARRKTVIEKVTSDIVHRILHDGSLGDSVEEGSGPRDNGSKRSREEANNRLELVFKMIDRHKREVTKTVSLEDSELLKGELEQTDSEATP